MKITPEELAEAKKMAEKYLPAHSAQLPDEVPAICEAIGVDLDTVMSTSRQNHKERWVVWKALRDRGYTYECIGHFFNMNHSSVRHGVVKLERELDGQTK